MKYESGESGGSAKQATETISPQFSAERVRTKLNEHIHPLLAHLPYVDTFPSRRGTLKVEDVAQMEELKVLVSKRNLAEELYSRIGPFNFDKNDAKAHGIMRNELATPETYEAEE